MRIRRLVESLNPKMLSILIELFQGTIGDIWRQKLHPDQPGPTLEERVEKFSEEERKVLAGYLQDMTIEGRQVRRWVLLSLTEIWGLSNEEAEEKMKRLGALLDTL